ncbi:MAG: VCBS repeat-containing protein [Planctomycetes bacterium]|nr:VCBS repeat-containing protein [Planctomycetota bacterium]
MKLIRTFAVVSMICLIAALAVGCSKKTGSGTTTASDIAANNRGVGLMGRYEYDEALTIFGQLVQAHPDWLDVKVNLAVATLNRQQDGDEAAAIDILKEVLEAEPNHLRALYVAAILLKRTGEPRNMATAFQYAQRVAEADPLDAYAAYQVGSGYRDAGKFSEALTWFERAVELDPYLQSAYYGSQQMLIRLGRSDEAAEMAQTFQRLSDNPRARIIKEIYGRMGPKAEALAIGLEEVEPVPRPTGALFEDPIALLADGEDYTWNPGLTDRPVSITACDINGDGLIDIFIANAMREADTLNAVIINQGDGGFALDIEHALARVTDVRAALWGDFDNDGLTDVYLCRQGANQLWRQTESNRWQDVTDSTGTANGDYDTVDGAFFDADHDGDLDIFCVNADGPNELLNNNLDGTFRAIAQAQGIAGDGRASRQVLVADLDSDRDVDIVVINNEPPHEVYFNDRLWRYYEADGFAEFRQTQVPAAVAVDLDADGQVELYTAFPGGIHLGRGSSWIPDTNGIWQTTELSVPPDWGVSRSGPTTHGSSDGFMVMDVTGSGELNLIDVGRFGAAVWGDGGALVQGLRLHTQGEQVAWTSVVLDSKEGAAVIALPANGAPIIWHPGPGRYKFTALQFTGKDDAANETRSNVSGIGVHAEIRIDSMWTVIDTFRNNSGPGQSLQPIAVGLGGHKQIDFVTMDWSDGVLQTEIDLIAGELHTIEEIQRQKSSCPVLFAWDGEKYEFVSDLLGVGGMGYLVAPGEYAPPRPWENFMLPLGLLRPKDGRYVLKLGEPMEEVCYLDSARLVVYDVPPGWKMTLDERMSILGPEPTGQPVFYRDEILPMRATNDRGEDVTSLLTVADRRAAPVGDVDRRFIGRLVDEHVLMLEFAEPIDARGKQPILIIDGWVEYPYSQTMFAAWQAQAEYRAPTIEALGDDGMWHIVLEQFGYPAGMPRQMSVPLVDLSAGATELRIRTNQEIYWDRISVAYAEPCPQAVRYELALHSAELSTVGFAHRTTARQRLPHYDYQNRRPFFDSRHMTGNYTAFGPVIELISETDNALAIFGPGEEIDLAFDALGDDPPAGWRRCFVFETRGWCKDMDLYTRDGETVGPLPTAGAVTVQRDRLHRRYNTRYESGW